MTLGQIRHRIVVGVDEDPLSPTTGLAAEVDAAINEGNRLAALLSLCLETTGNFALNGQCWHTPRATFPFMIAPLRIIVSGVRLRPATLAELDARDIVWQARSGPTERYASLGCNLWAFTPQSITTAQVTYAYWPATMTLDNQVPEIPEEYHQNLVDYGVYKVRLKDGAQGLERGLKRLNTFLDAMTRLGDWVRARSRAARYDTLPMELAKFDRSRMIENVLKAQEKRRPKASGN